MTVTALLLGNAQDAGFPQAGCLCDNCRAAWADLAGAEFVCALALLDAGQNFLIDATPDFKIQLRRMQVESGSARLAGILITHAHIGHYAGLIHLGYEAMAVRALPLFGSRRLNTFLRTNAPWRQLIEQENIVLNEMMPDRWHALTPSLSVMPVAVPHRDEWSDTLGFIVRGPARRLLYLPDIDGWDQWSRPVREVVAGVDVALLDGTFFSLDELPARDMSGIGHPLVTDTMARLAGLSTDVRFIHLNHSNPLQRPGPEREWVKRQGFRIGQTGDRWQL